MDKELEKYYVARMEMFSSQGWKDLLVDAAEMKTSYLDIHNVNTIEQLLFRKGQLDILDWIASIEELSRKAYDDLLEEDQ
jgi:hypothetical protein